MRSEDNCQLRQGRGLGLVDPDEYLPRRGVWPLRAHKLLAKVFIRHATKLQSIIQSGKFAGGGSHANADDAKLYNAAGCAPAQRLEPFRTQSLSLGFLR